ncbi:DNA-directed DNA polymerase [Methanonatronarchaeum sp. AMET6-2]|uniref:DNA-directed DNA polymerase n=1 Tax=Methanonatronarchaeum sp. AMET6-2 TaxID=2933293 RepID=UPI0011F559DF|nr:DNA-directed DNA polymerase [Methanonatronarchaeum sp. AMET6-2]RZN63224.1 MAG: DNA polymerase [Methanonatronarchaeia archaeon]UOY10516.1 DNA-directed DNA polymerase [Methanonatronarchaeum sp. AMET6-2]
MLNNLLMDIEGIFLDADYLTEYGEPVIRLWIKNKNKVTVAFEKNFEPYFYAVPDKGVDYQELQKKLENIEGERYDEIIKPKKTKVVTRRDFGSEIKVIKIVAEHPQHVPTLRKEAKETKGVEEYREADIPFVNRYIIDKNLTPSSKIHVEGKPVECEYADTALEIDKVDGKFIEKTPELSKLTFDCEMYNKGRSPDPEKDPIIIISIVKPDGKTKLLVSEGKDDKEIIKQFKKEIQETDPDAILTYNGDDFDWPYLKKRAQKHGIKLEVGRDKSEIDIRGGGRRTVSIKGRLNIDLYRVADRDLGEVKIKSLEEVSDYLNVIKSDERTAIPGHRIGEYWDDKEKRKILLEYAEEDAVSTAGVADELLPNQLEFSKLTKQTADEISKMGRGRQVEWYLIAKAKEQKELVPNRGGYRNSSGNTYLGGFVLEPEKGLHENVVSLDFSSMYPSLMISYNISPDTYISPEETKEHSEYHEAPEVGHKFKKGRDGFFKEILQELISFRNKIKNKIDETQNQKEIKSLKVREKAIKTLTNSFYGYTGWGAARWYKKECAEATTAWGREMIDKAIQTARKKDLKVIYGDTDSIFIKTPGGKLKIKKEATELKEKLNQTLPLEIEIEKLYRTIFFTEKKKRYAGLDENGEIYIRGLEVRRGDWCDLAKELQKKVIEIILKNKDPEKAVKLVKKTIKKLKKGEISLEKLVIRKTLSKSISKYESRQAHVHAAEKAKKQGIEVGPGQKISFVVTTKGGKKIGERSFPIEMFSSYEEGTLTMQNGRKIPIDVDYYTENQVIPAVSRILNYFGYNSNDLKGEPSQRKLGEF